MFHLTPCMLFSAGVHTSTAWRLMLRNINQKSTSSNKNQWSIKSQVSDNEWGRGQHKFSYLLCKGAPEVTTILRARCLEGPSMMQWYDDHDNDNVFSECSEGVLPSLWKAWLPNTCPTKEGCLTVRATHRLRRKPRVFKLLVLVM